MARTLRAVPSLGGYHPHAARRCAPAIMRIQRTNPPASKLASGFAADPPSVRLKICVMIMNSKKKTVLERIKSLEDSIVKGHEYLECGKNAKWQGFQPWFVEKVRDSKVLPPHKDWVKNVFLPRCERALTRSEKTLEKLTLAEKMRERKPRRK
jgi:hypothetical protein